MTSPTHPRNVRPSRSEPESDTSDELRSFGRRRGRKLSPRQTDLQQRVLPAVALDLTEPCPADASALFARRGTAVTDIWLEIGFGGAEHLIWQAERHPAIGLIGCEPFEEGVAKALTAIDEQDLRNVLLHPDDARMVLRWLPRASIGRAFVLFPDPWPKKRHAKRRLVNARTLALLADALRPGGELRIATDIGDYARTILSSFQQIKAFDWRVERPTDWRERPSDWPTTRYEAKAHREGRPSYFFRFQRT